MVSFPDKTYLNTTLFCILKQGFFDKGKQIRPVPYSFTWKLTQGEGLEFDMKYHIFHDFRTFTAFKENSFDHSEDLHKVKFLTNFDVNLTSSPGGVMH